jgi:hypothetical protein
METKLDIIDISEWPLNKKEKTSGATSGDASIGPDGKPRKRSKSQSGAVSAYVLDFC